MNRTEFELAIGGSCVALASDLERTFSYRGVQLSVAEDLAQETIVRAFRNWEKFDHTKGHVRAWVFKIADNVLKSHFRAVKRDRSVLLYPDQDIPDQDVFGLADRAIVLGEAFRYVAKSFSTIDRQIFVMRLTQMSNTDIAQVLGVDRKTVTNRLASIRKRLGRFE